MHDTFRHSSIRENRSGSISFRHGAASFSEESRPEMHCGVRTGHVFYHLSNSREALRCHRNPFKLPRFAEMAFLGAWALLARCPSGKKRGLCVHQEASRGDIFSPRTPGNPPRIFLYRREKCQAKSCFSRERLMEHYRIRPDTPS